MSPILADVVWPALIVSARLAAVWCIAASILIEAAALWRFAQWRPVKALVASVVMNAVSAFCGSLLLPVAGLRWETTATLTYEAWFGWSTFNLVSEGAALLIAVILSTVIETFVLWLVFCAPWTRRLTLVVLCANVVTVLLAEASMLLFPSRW
jgi:hypothetical protein